MFFSTYLILSKRELVYVASEQIECTNKRPLSKLSPMLYYCEMSMQVAR
jgi:hypothetical protein